VRTYPIFLAHRTLPQQIVDRKNNEKIHIYGSRQIAFSSCTFWPLQIEPILLFFLKLEPNTRSLAINQKNQILLRVSTIRSKRGYFERKKGA
jgi:hypothetical protein